MAYMGLCAVCFENDADHDEWIEFGPVDKRIAELMGNLLRKAELPTDVAQAQGIWQGVCKWCCDKTAKHREATVL